MIAWPRSCSREIEAHVRAHPDRARSARGAATVGAERLRARPPAAVGGGAGADRRAPPGWSSTSSPRAGRRCSGARRQACCRRCSTSPARMPFRPRRRAGVPAADPAAGTVIEASSSWISCSPSTTRSTRRGIPHAIGGAIALGYCTLEPRGTQRPRRQRVRRPRARAGRCSRRCRRGSSSAATSLEHAGTGRPGASAMGHHAGRRLPQRAAVPRSTSSAHVRQVAVRGTARSRSSSCTALAVFKAMFDRPRDWVDIEAMVEARSLDLDEAKRWVLRDGGRGPARREARGAPALELLGRVRADAGDGEAVSRSRRRPREPRRR